MSSLFPSPCIPLTFSLSPLASIPLPQSLPHLHPDPCPCLPFFLPFPPEGQSVSCPSRPSIRCQIWRSDYQLFIKMYICTVRPYPIRSSPVIQPRMSSIYPHIFGPVHTLSILVLPLLLQFHSHGISPLGSGVGAVSGISYLRPSFLGLSYVSASTESDYGIIGCPCRGSAGLPLHVFLTPHRHPSAHVSSSSGVPGSTPYRTSVVVPYMVTFSLRYLHVSIMKLLYHMRIHRIPWYRIFHFHHRPLPLSPLPPLLPTYRLSLLPT